MSDSKTGVGKRNWWADIFFLAMATAVCLTLFGFYQTMMGAADNPAHLNTARFLFSSSAGIDYPKHTVTYPLYHLSTKILALMLGGRYEAAGAVVLTASSICAIFVTRHILKSFIGERTPLDSWLINTVSICSIFFGTLKGPLTEGRYYAGQCAANPWHNPTIIFVRPFGLATFYVFVLLLKKMKEGKSHKKELLAFSFLSAISSLAKPSYTIVLIPAAGILVLLYWVRDLKGRLYMAMQMLLAVAPTIFIIIFQFLYDKTEAGVSVGIAFGSFFGFTLGEVACVSLATFPVPIAVFAVCGRKEMLEDEYMQLPYMTLLFGWVEMFTLTNGSAGDFSWGYDLSVGLATVMALGYVMKKYDRKWQMYLAFFVFLLQTASGLHYFYLVKVQEGIYWF